MTEEEIHRELTDSYQTLYDTLDDIADLECRVIFSKRCLARALNYLCDSNSALERGEWVVDLDG